MKTLTELSNADTLVVMSYEERSTGDKPELERRFFEARRQVTSGVLVYIPDSVHACPFADLRPSPP